MIVVFDTGDLKDRALGIAGEDPTAKNRARITAPRPGRSRRSHSTKCSMVATYLDPISGRYRLTPNRFEFWQHRGDRLHDRMVYLSANSDVGPSGSLSLQFGVFCTSSRATRGPKSSATIVVTTPTI
jgi:Pyridoxine 5'-phosphate oxidase C-terminal dimerisation region